MAPIQIADIIIYIYNIHICASFTEYNNIEGVLLKLTYFWIFHFMYFEYTKHTIITIRDWLHSVCNRDAEVHCKGSGVVCIAEPATSSH